VKAALCCKATTLAFLCAFKRKLEQNGQEQKAKVEHEHHKRKRLGELPSLQVCRHYDKEQHPQKSKDVYPDIARSNLWFERGSKVSFFLQSDSRTQILICKANLTVMGSSFQAV
jgi:hypothetical protein